MHQETTHAEVDTWRILWRFGPIVFGPTLLFGVCEGALMPVLPAIAVHLGADVSQAALVASVIILARLVGNIPSGWLVWRIGERHTMMLAGILALASVIGVIFAQTVSVLLAAVFVMGFAAAALGISRQTFLATRIPRSHRARAMSILGGSFRMGMFPAPFITAGLIALCGDERVAAVFAGICYAFLIILVTFGPDPVGMFGAGPERGTPGSGNGTAIRGRAEHGVFKTIWVNRTALLQVGLPSAALSALRQARVYMLPLVGVFLAVDSGSISLVVGITGAIEFAFFYTSGQIMDRWGRLAAVLPSMALMGVSFILVGAAAGFPSPFVWFLAAAIVMGLGNGISSGVLMTLGADLAPQDDPAKFLGAWRTTIDGAGALVPFAVTALSAMATLSAAAFMLGALGFAGALGFWHYLPRFVKD